MSLKDKIWQVSPLGTFCIVSGTILLCLALQWGGVTYAWSSARVIVCLTLAFVLLIAFALVQVWLPDQAILPPPLFLQRSIAAGFWANICIGAHQTLFLYYLPIWFQAIKGKSAVKSGVDLLAMVIPIAVTSLVSGGLIVRIGYYTPFLILGTCLTSISAGLITTFRPGTSKGKWIGYQVLYGIGQGFVSQIPSMAAYTVLPKENIAIGTSLMFFGQTLFSAIFVSVGQNVLDQQLVKRLRDIPGVTRDLITSTGATNLLGDIPSVYRQLALLAYNDSLRRVFDIAVCMACISLLGAVCMEWRTVKKKKSPPKDVANEKSVGTQETAENSNAANTTAHEARGSERAR